MPLPLLAATAEAGAGETTPSSAPLDQWSQTPASPPARVFADNAAAGQIGDSLLNSGASLLNSQNVTAGLRVFGWNHAELSKLSSELLCNHSVLATGFDALSTDLMLIAH